MVKNTTFTGLTAFSLNPVLRGIENGKIGIESQRANAKEHNEMSKLSWLDARTGLRGPPRCQGVWAKSGRTFSRIGVGGTCNTCHSN